MFFHLKEICVGVTTVTAILFVGCGKASIDDSSTEAGQVEALKKEAASLKSKLASVQSHIENLRLEAQNIGFPLLIKPVTGGGGRGMRQVNQLSQFDEALTLSRSEAKTAFGDDAVLLERFISGPRHIEFQIFSDRKGNMVHLHERECSIQRRHQHRRH